MKKETGSKRTTKLKIHKETLNLLEPTQLQKIAAGESNHSFCAGTRENCCYLT